MHEGSHSLCGRAAGQLIEHALVLTNGVRQQRRRGLTLSKMWTGNEHSTSRGPNRAHSLTSSRNDAISGASAVWDFTSHSLLSKGMMSGRRRGNVSSSGTRSMEKTCNRHAWFLQPRQTPP